jgi:two-component system chemotaxis response regulator CheB
MAHHGAPLKIMGNEDLIKKRLLPFDLPPGSKIIYLETDGLIQLNPDELKIKFSGKRKKRVAVIDDSPTMRKLLKQIIGQLENWEVVAEGESAEEIPGIIKNFYPDIFSLDINLGKMDGAEAMRHYLAPQKFPTILVSSLPKNDGGLVMEALSCGAIDYIQKPEAGSWESMKEEFLLKLESGLKSKWQGGSVGFKERGEKIKTSLDFDSTKFLLVIGSSTGGTQALQEILTRFPEKIPPILITQHIPAGFSKALAERLNKLCPFEVKEAEDGDRILPNRVLIAPGDHHLRVSKNGLSVEVMSTAPVNRFRPSVEVLFKSVKENAKVQVLAVMLTGMGKDGAEAMCELKKSGAFTIAQDEESSVVFGMPKEVIRLGGASKVYSLSEMPEKIYRYFCSKK